MKKAFTLVVLIVTPTMAFAQGTVALQNQTGLVKQWTSLTDQTLIPVPKNGGYVELMSAPVGTALANPNLLLFSSLAAFLAANPGWSLPDPGSSPTPAIIGFGAGLFNSGTLILHGIPGGANAEYIIAAWTGAFTTYDAAYAAALADPNASVIGLSPIATTATGNPSAIPPGTAVSLRPTFPGITLPGCLSCGQSYFQGFTMQPTNQTVLVGATATFYVGASAYPSPYYQWYFNGVNIPWATGSSFQISNAQLTNAGTYWVVLSNPGWGIRISDSAILTVLAPPVITTPPQSQTAVVGSTIYFRASATGSAPLAYQWFFNSTNSLSGGTGPVLRLTDVQPAQAGAYTVVVTNIAGPVTSTSAMLSVIPPVEQRLVPGLALLGQPGSLLNLQDADTLGPSPAWVTLDSVHVHQYPPMVFRRFYAPAASAVLSGLADQRTQRNSSSQLEDGSRPHLDRPSRKLGARGLYQPVRAN